MSQPSALQSPSMLSTTQSPSNSQRNIRVVTNERKQLEQKIKSAYPSLSFQKRKKKFNEYWSDICVNLSAHRKRKIDVDKYMKIMNDLQKVVSNKVGNLQLFWGVVPTTPKPKQIQPKIRLRPDSESIESTPMPQSVEPKLKKRKILMPATPKAPKQERCIAVINDLNSEIARNDWNFLIINNMY